MHNSKIEISQNNLIQGLKFTEIYLSQEAGCWDQLKERQASIWNSITQAEQNNIVL